MRGPRVEKTYVTPDTHVYIPGTGVCVILIAPDAIYTSVYIRLLVLALFMFIPR